MNDNKTAYELLLQGKDSALVYHEYSWHSTNAINNLQKSLWVLNDEHVELRIALALKQPVTKNGRPYVYSSNDNLQHLPVCELTKFSIAEPVDFLNKFVRYGSKIYLVTGVELSLIHI